MIVTGTLILTLAKTLEKNLQRIFLKTPGLCGDHEKKEFNEKYHYTLVSRRSFVSSFFSIFTRELQMFPFLSYGDYRYKRREWFQRYRGQREILRYRFMVFILFCTKILVVNHKMYCFFIHWLQWVIISIDLILNLFSGEKK